MQKAMKTTHTTQDLQQKVVLRLMKMATFFLVMFSTRHLKSFRLMVL
jgi:hypothetical protein